MRNCRFILNAQEIKDGIASYDFYVREQNLQGYRTHGWVVAGYCPFHEDGNPGSFKIHTDSGAFKCWSCGTSGRDIIDFLIQRDGLSFREALQKLCNDWGISTC